MQLLQLDELIFIRGVGPLPGAAHRTDNGLLLRSDIHTLYDGGYLGVNPKYRLLVSPRLRDEFGNGEQLYAIDGSRSSCLRGGVTVPTASPSSGTSTRSTSGRDRSRVAGRLTL